MASKGPPRTVSRLEVLLLAVLLVTAHIGTTDGSLEYQLKKLLKKFMILKLLSPKKTISVIPLPIPIAIMKKDEPDLMHMGSYPEMAMTMQKYEDMVEHPMMHMEKYMPMHMSVPVEQFTADDAMRSLKTDVKAQHSKTKTMVEESGPLKLIMTPEGYALVDSGREE